MSTAARAGRWVALLWLALLGLAALAVAVPNTPAITPIPGRDSGVYLYVADHLLQGEMPYRDLWDHKPPLIYLIDALGLWLGGGSRWGVWALEVAALWAAAALGWRLLRRVFGGWVAGAASLTWLLALALVLPRGNFTEEFALPLQFAVLALAAGGVAGRRPPLRWLLAGAGGAGLALLRPNLVAVALAAGAWLLWRAAAGGDGRRAWRAIGWAVLGGVLPLAAVAAWLAANDALAPFWDQVIRYNGIYSQAGWADRWRALREGWLYLRPSGLMAVGLLGWAAAVYLAVRRRGAAAPAGTPAPWMPIVLIALPVELWLAAMSGRAYRHYYIAWLPGLALLAAWALAQASALLGRRWGRPWRGVLPALALAAMTMQPTLTLAAKCVPAEQSDDAIAQAVAYVRAHAAPGEAVLVWGAEAAVNFASDRPAPTRYVYQYPLYTVGYADAAMWARFRAEIAATPPALIIDSSPGNEDVPPIAAAARETWRADLEDYRLPDELDAVADDILAHYRPVARLGAEGWVVYERIR